MAIELTGEHLHSGERKRDFMETYELEVSKMIKADPERVYRVLSDYQNEHPNILPKPYFSNVEVERGGIGAGTVVKVQMKVMGTVQHFRLTVSEPRPGREIHEEDPEAGIKTIFTLEPGPDRDRCQVTLKTLWQKKKGMRGLLERLLNPLIIRPIYVKELNLLEAYCEEKLT